MRLFLGWVRGNDRRERGGSEDNRVMPVGTDENLGGSSGNAFSSKLTLFLFLF